ncbi:MAG: hypothetical protein ABFD50_04675 [Smithella sp.]
MKLDLNDYTRFDATGRMSVTNTMFAIEQSVANYAVQHNDLIDRIENAVNDVFDQSPGKDILPVTAIVSKVVEALNPRMEDIGKIQKEVAVFLRRSERFETIRGRDGGCRRTGF